MSELSLLVAIATLLVSIVDVIIKRAKGDIFDKYVEGVNQP